MWLLVLFDLPTMTDVVSKAATRFRNALLRLGFERMQLSVYARRCPGLMETMMGEVRRVLPVEGDVSIIALTDLQFAGITRLRGGFSVIFEAQKRLICF